jgi:uncharacterized protein YkwD
MPRARAASKDIVSTLKIGWAVVVLLVTFPAAAVAQDAGSESAAAEQELFRMINQDRAQQGVAALEWNEWLAQAARKHAAEMARRGQLSHQFAGEPSPRDRIAATSLRFNATAENVAFGPTAEGINGDWMHSPGHRANILDPKYNAIGVAVARSGNELYAVTDFAHTVTNLSSADLEDAASNAINQVRAQRKLSPLPRRQDPELRRYACEMAKNNRVNANAVLSRPGVSASLAFTDADPANLGSHFRNVSNVTESRAFAVGACFARSSTYPEGTNWIVVAFY